MLLPMTGVGLRVSVAAALKVEDIKPRMLIITIMSEVGKGRMP